MRPAFVSAMGSGKWCAADRKRRHVEVTNRGENALCERFKNVCSLDSLTYWLCVFFSQPNRPFSLSPPPHSWYLPFVSAVERSSVYWQTVQRSNSYPFYLFLSSSDGTYTRPMNFLDSKQTNFLIMNDVMACRFDSILTAFYLHRHSVHMRAPNES